MKRPLPRAEVAYVRPRLKTLQRLAQWCELLREDGDGDAVVEPAVVPVVVERIVPPAPPQTRGLVTLVAPPRPPRVVRCPVCRDDGTRVNGGTCAACGRARVS